MYFIKEILICFCGVLLLLNFTCAQKPVEQWEEIESGMFLGVFEAPAKSELGDSRITVLKIDPEMYEFDIYCASQYGKSLRSVSRWAADMGLTAVINAGMYQQDYLTAVGFMKSGDHVNNSRLAAKYNSIFACKALDKNVPEAQILDLKCIDFTEWQDKYHVFAQSIRMIDCGQKNVWEQQPQKWSIAALGMDKAGKILFIHCRSPYTVHDFINILLELPLDIYNALYLEGGPEASMYYSTNGRETELCGSYENGFFPSNDNTTAWKIPNVIGARKRGTD